MTFKKYVRESAAVIERAPLDGMGLVLLVCPFCERNLQRVGRCVQDDHRGVNIVCGGCHHRSMWNFDCPGPFTIGPQ